MLHFHRQKLLFVIVCALLAVGCANPQDKQSYRLSDTTLHSYAPGDTMIYSIVSGTRTTANGIKEFFGEVTTSFDRSPISTYPDASDATGLSGSLIETTSIVTSDQNDEVIQRHLYQDATGSMFLFMLETANDISLWIKPKDQSTFAVKTILSPLVPEQMLSPQFDVYQCLTLCELVGDGGEVSNYIGIETVSTPFGDFETYAFNYSYTLTISKSELGLSALKTTTGKKWVYPGAGVVMYSASTTDASSSDAVYFIAALQRTNLKLNPN